MSVVDGHERTDSAVARAARGDRDAFAEIVALHHASMVRLAYVICGDRDLALDAVQNAWQRAWQKLRTLRDVDHIRPWLLSVAANEARQAVRRRTTRRQREIAGAPGTHTAPDADDRIDLARALERLSPEERHLLALRYVLELSSPEIARQLRISPEGVRSRTKRLIDRLRRELTDA